MKLDAAGKAVQPGLFVHEEWPYEPKFKHVNGWRIHYIDEGAGDPVCGGLGNFLRCHMTVVKMLDAAKDLGVLRDVCDESDYWDHRNIDYLINRIGGWERSLEGIRSLFQEEQYFSLSRDDGGELI